MQARLLVPDDPGPLPVIVWAGGEDVAVKLPLEELASRGDASCVVSDGGIAAGAASSKVARALEDAAGSDLDAGGIWGGMRRFRGPALVCRDGTASHRAFDDARRAAEDFPNARLVTLGEGPRVVGEAMWLSHAVDEVVRFIRQA